MRPPRGIACHDTSDISEERAEDSEYKELIQDGPVGFSAITDQIVFKRLANEIPFNVLCIGETGVGKSMLVDSLFNTTLESTQSPHTMKSLGMKVSTFEVTEANVRVRLTVIETVGFGDQLNSVDSLQVLTEFVDTQYEAYFQEDMKVERNFDEIFDPRIHVCLYLIRPSGHKLRSLDIECLKRLSSRVNIIPVIAKSDCLTKLEIDSYKKRILQDIHEHKIKVYMCPIDDEDIGERNMKLNECIPLGVVASNDFTKLEGKWQRARVFPWGTILIDDPAHSDFTKLREVMIHNNFNDLIDTCHSVYYQAYRISRMKDLELKGINHCEEDNTERSVGAQREEYYKNMQAKSEDFLVHFNIAVKEKDEELKRAEKEILEKFSLLKKDYEESKKHLDNERRILDEELSKVNKIKAELEKRMTSEMKTGDFKEIEKIGDRK